MLEFSGKVWGFAGIPGGLCTDSVWLYQPAKPLKGD